MNTNPYHLTLKKYATHARIVDMIGSGKTVLDVGCNDGYIGLSSDKTNTFYGLDYMADSVKVAKRTYKDALVYDLNKLHALPWKKKFDVIVFADVLEHVHEPLDTLRYFVDNYLAEGGKVIVSLPNIAHASVRIKLMLGQFNYTETGILDKTHLHFYTFKTAEALVSQAGLSVERAEGGAALVGALIQGFPPLKPLLANSVILSASK